MSGGSWDYLSHRIQDVADSIQNLINRNGKEMLPRELRDSYKSMDWYEKYPEDRFYHKYPDEIIEEFKKAIIALRIAAIYERRVDWLISGDDGEETFIERLKEDLKVLDENRL
jgi:hypothetical protein